MRIPPFLLDQWIATYEFASPPIRYNLAASTGPGWTLGELLALGDGAGVNGLGDLRLSYAPVVQKVAPAVVILVAFGEKCS